MNHKETLIRDTALRTWITLLVIMGTGLGLVFLYSVRSVILELVIAAVLAIALTPVVKFLMRHGFNQVTASIVTLLLTAIVVLGLLGAIASPLITQSKSLVDNAPDLVTKIADSPIVSQLDSQFHLASKVKSYAAELPKLLSSNSKPIIAAVGSVVDVITKSLIVLVFTLFILMEGTASWHWFIQILGRKRGKTVDRIAGKVRHAVSSFVTGNLLISVIAGIVALAVLLITRVPYAFALAALVAVFDLIPLVGATIATIVLALVALTKGLLVAVIVVVVMLVYQLVEGHIIQPIIYGRALKLSQLLIIVATIIGALLGGIIGVLRAIPVASVVAIVVTELLEANGADPTSEDKEVIDV